MKLQSYINKHASQKNHCFALYTSCHVAITLNKPCKVSPYKMKNTNVLI